jgi:putative hydrolase of the HAD superfamily
MTTSVVTFDAGQTLVDLDLDFLAGRLAERELAMSPSRLEGAAPSAWRRYDALVEAGNGHAWQGFMNALLEGAGVEGERIGPLVDWLWHEQPRRNLWRKPIADMVALARELRARGARVAVLSNSEGRLAELLVEIGISDAFEVIVDSGRIGIDKPDPRIFAHALAALGASGGERHAVHVGDSWSADVLGAINAGWRAVWYQSRDGHTSPVRPDVAVARDAGEVRAVLHAFGV